MTIASYITISIAISIMLFFKVAIYVIYLVILRSRAIYMLELDSYYDDYIATI